MDLSLYFTRQDLWGILPEIVLLVGALIILSIELFARSQRAAMLGVGILTLVIAGGFAAKNFGSSFILFQGMITLNDYSTFFDLLYMAAGIVTMVISFNYLERKGGKTRGEYFALILFATMGMMLMTRGNDLVIIFLGLELLSLSLYVLVGFLRHDIFSNESAIKYLLLGAFATGFFLFGAVLVYGTTGTTNFQHIALAITNNEILSDTLLSLGIGLLLVGFAFKVALVPFHMWSPDVYQGAPTSVTAFLCTAPKAAGFGALLKVFLVAFPALHADWQDLLWALALLTMIVGNISALVQTNVKRMLAFSSVTHAGYLCIGILVLNEMGVSAILFYLLVYSVMNLGAFGIISLLEKEEKGVTFNDYDGLASRHPWLSASLAIFMLSLAGFPPTAGFVAKYTLFSSAISEGYIWLVIIAILNTLVSVYYYIRLIVNMYMKTSEETLVPFLHPLLSVVIFILAISIMFFGILPGWLIDTATQAARIYT